MFRNTTLVSIVYCLRSTRIGKIVCGRKIIVLYWLQVPYKKIAICWVITQQAVVIPYRRFGATYRPHLQGSLEEASLIYFAAEAWRCASFLKIRHNIHSTLSYSGNDSIFLSALGIFESHQEVICHLCRRQYGIDQFSLTGNNNSVTNSALCGVDCSQVFINKPKRFSLSTQT
jgi:hypothetical protein